MSKKISDSVNDMSNVEKGELENRLAKLQECEEKIQIGKHSYKKVGDNLKRINDEKLYQCSEYKTFEEYAQCRWGHKKSQAYVLIHSAEVWDNLSDGGLSKNQMPDAAKSLDLLYGFEKKEQISGSSGFFGDVLARKPVS